MSAPSPTPWEIRRDAPEEGGGIDEVIARGADIHLERMAAGHVWLCIRVGKRTLHVDLTAWRGSLRMRAEER